MEFGGDPRVRMFPGDVLSRPFARLARARPAARPRRSSSPTFRTTSRRRSSSPPIEAPGVIRRVVATIQREVARRFIARPGDEAYGYLSYAPLRSRRAGSSSTFRRARSARGRRSRPSVLELTPRPELPDPDALPPRADARLPRLQRAQKDPRQRSCVGGAARGLGEGARGAREVAARPRGGAFARGVPRARPRVAGSVTGALEIVPLGGRRRVRQERPLAQVRRDSSILVDVGVSFADESFPGIDRIAPDLSALSPARGSKASS